MRIARSAALAVAVAALFLSLLPAASGGAPPSDGGWRVVSYASRITQADRDALGQAGGSGIGYLPRNKLVVNLSAEGAEEAARMPGVISVAALQAGQKIDRALPAAGSARPLTVSVRAPARAAVSAALASRFPVASGGPVAEGIHDLVVLASPAEARSIAANPDVLYVGPAPSGLAPTDEMSDQIQAGNAVFNSVTPGYEAWLEARGVDGEGEVISIVDSGIDPAHPDLLGRIRARVDYAPVGQTGNPVDEPVDTLGHGTHVAGIVAADANGLQPATRVEDPAGYLYGLGVAPKAELVDQNALSTLASGVLCGFVWPPPYQWSTLSTDALDSGASVWNASWWSCEDSQGNYIATNRTFDQLTRDADPATAGDQPFTFVFAAANFGPRVRSVTAPASAKNVISVGATVNGRGGNINSIASFSSRGPAADGRILPTIVSPGSSVVSTRSSASTAACSVPVTDGLTLYSSCSGTSMAAPHVAGAVALVRQWWGKSNAADPSPAMTKALLVNTATDLGAADIPNGNEGWGRVNLGALFSPGEERVYEDQGVVLDDPDQAQVYRVRPADPTKPLKVTLAWSDAAGLAGASPALVNDLDLELVAADGTTYLGNRFSSGRSVPGGVPNRLDNLENVYLATPQDDIYTVRVAAFDLPGDGSFEGDETDQDFALVISNAVIVSE